MRTIIAGSREIDQMYLLTTTLELINWDITSVVSGVAKGPDTLGLIYAQRKGLPVSMYPADWETHGKSAGYIRNIEMAKNADACVVLWNGESRGSLHMVNTALKHGLLLFVRTLRHDSFPKRLAKT